MRQSVTTRIAVRLITAVGAPVLGALPADVLSATAYVKKSDGSIVTVALTNASYTVTCTGIHDLDGNLI